MRRLEIVMLLSWNVVTQFSSDFLEISGSGWRMGAGRRTKKEEDRRTIHMHPHSTFTPQTESFVFHSPQPPVPGPRDSHFSILDHNCPSFQFFLPLYSKPFFIFTETSNTWFPCSLCPSETCWISSFCAQPRIRWIISPRASSNQHYPPLPILHLVIHLGLLSWVWDGCSYTRLHAQKVAPCLGLLLSSRHLEILIVYLCTCVLQAKSNGTTKHWSGAWRLCSCVHLPVAISSPPWYIGSHLPVRQLFNAPPPPQWVLDRGWHMFTAPQVLVWDPKGLCRFSPHRSPGSQKDHHDIKQSGKNTTTRNERDCGRKENVFPDCEHEVAYFHSAPCPAK